MNIEENQELLCCRACLAPDCGLYNIHEYNLADIFAAISGTPIRKDGLSPYLCMYCHSLLLKCVSFRAMCVQTQQSLMPELLKEELNLENINNISRLSQRLYALAPSEVQIVACFETVPINLIKNEHNYVAELNDHEIIAQKNYKLGIDLNNDEDYVSNKDTVDIEKENNEDLTLKLEEEHSYSDLNYDDDDNNEVIHPVEEVKSLGKRKRTLGATKSKTIEKANKKAPIKRKKVESKISDTSIDKSDNTDVLDTVKDKRKRRDPANDYMPLWDLAEFEKTHGVKIITLSKQEQLEEIAMRKQSPNYKGSRFRCEDCGKGFDMEEAFNNHLRRHSPNAGQFSCEICSVRFRWGSQQRRHQDTHRFKFVCNECGFMTRTCESAKVHHQVHQGKRFTCQHCSKTYCKRTSYFSHVRLSHPALNVACEQCGETFVGQGGLMYHKARMHSEFKCLTCPAKFVSLDALNRHTDTGEHSGSPCKQCGESCASEEALQAHVGERHPKETHRCEECDKSFATASSLRTHADRVHLKIYFKFKKPRGAYRDKRYPAGQQPKKPITITEICEICGKGYKNATLLRYHLRLHSGELPHKCPECPRAYNTPSLLRQHSASHTRERRYPCPRCPKTFLHPSALYKHKLIHADEKPFTCNICSKGFPRPCWLTQHIRQVHMKVNPPPPPRTRKRKRQSTKETI